jgi:hypothetical protein
MRVLIYSHAFLPKVGGTETIVMLLAQGLARHADFSPNADLLQFWTGTLDERHYFGLLLRTT